MVAQPSIKDLYPQLIKLKWGGTIEDLNAQNDELRCQLPPAVNGCQPIQPSSGCLQLQERYRQSALAREP